MVQNLAEHGHEVIAASHAELPDLPAHTEVFDIGSLDNTRRVVERYRPRAAIHLAAQASVPHSWEDPAETYRVNVIGASNVLEAARDFVEEGLLLVGSAQQYGPAGDRPLRETDPSRPLSPYAVSKSAQEMIGLVYHRRFNMRIVLARPFNHTGPGQSKEYAVGSFCSQIVEAEKGLRKQIQVGGLGAVRDFLDVRDVVEAYRLLLEAGRSGEVYNVCSGRGVLINDVLKMLLELSLEAGRLELVSEPGRVGDPDTLIGDNSKLKFDVGWEPRIPLETSLADTLAWYRERE